MPDRSPPIHRVLIAEDEYMLAEDLRMQLEEHGLIAVGPVGNVRKLLQFIASGELFDAAILDVNLNGESVFDAAEQLLSRGVPFVFATGYDAASIPEQFQNVPCLSKPFQLPAALEAIHHFC